MSEHREYAVVHIQDWTCECTKETHTFNRILKKKFVAPNFFFDGEKKNSFDFGITGMVDKKFLPQTPILHHFLMNQLHEVEIQKKSLLYPI